MGMDVHGLNPKENKTLEDFPVLKKYREMEFDKKWEELDKDEKMREKYWEETKAFEKANPGVYFRNNCWWWRPLWDFCYNVAQKSECPNLISEELWSSGHHNDGAGLNDEDAKLLGTFLLRAIEDGFAEDYKEWHEAQEIDADYRYPFDKENVKEFANFCLESGGFEIC